MKAIEICNLTKNYGKARGIENLTFSVEKGEFFGFIGPNGAGKSTTIRSLLGMLKPTSGYAQIMEKNCWDDVRTIHSDIGYLPSENSFYPGMKVNDILKLSAELRHTECNNEAERLCGLLQLDRKKKASELSYGNRKKLSIICALQHNPEILILDEPTGGLDPLMQKVFFDILRERNKDGKTIFFSSHILSEVQYNCDRIAIIKNGELIACDAKENLIPHNVKKVEFSGKADLSALNGVRNLTISSDRTNFLYNGETSLLIRKLAEGNIDDIQINESVLGQVFMHYYEGGI